MGESIDLGAKITMIIKKNALKTNYLEPFFPLEMPSRGISAHTGPNPVDGASRPAINPVLPEHLLTFHRAGGTLAA